MATLQSTVNPAIPAANSTLSSGPIRSQFQAAANDINTIYGLISGYPIIVQQASNMVISSTGQMQRSAYGIPITMTRQWQLVAHDGVSEFYTTPTYVANFVSAGYNGPAIVFQGWDWYIYAVNAITGALLTGFPVATNGPCYGRVVAANIDTGGYAGNTMIFACTHGSGSYTPGVTYPGTVSNQGNTGAIIALHSDGSLAWVKFNAYVDEGGNDGNNSISFGTPTTLSSNINNSTTTIPVTSGTNIANGNYIAVASNVSTQEIMYVVSGGGTTSLTVVRGQLGTSAASFSSGAQVNTGFQTLGGRGSLVGLSVASATSSSVTISGASPNWSTNAWTRVEGLGYGAICMVVSGTGAFQQKEITGVTGGNTLTINGTWSVTPDNTSIIQILPRYTSDMTIQHAGTLNVESGITYLYTTANDNTICKRTATSGAKQWRYWALENCEPFPLIAPVADGVTPSVMFNSVDSYTYNLSLAGTLNWKTQGVSGVGLDSYLAAANISNTTPYQTVVVNQRRSGNAKAGRCYTLRGDTGAKVSCSGDQLGDGSSGPLLIPRTDGSGKYYVFAASNATLVTLYDDQMNGLWRHRYADNSEIDQFRSTPFLADVNYDGVNEIVLCAQNTGTVYVFSIGGTLLATLTLPAFLNTSTLQPNADCGIEGTPCTFLNNGLLNMIIPSKDGTINCYQFNQNAG